MIQNDAQLEQACEALGDLYQVLAAYRTKVLPANPRNYLLLAQGPLEEIRKIQAEIDAYLGLNGQRAEGSDVDESKPVGALREKPPGHGDPRGS